MHLFLVVSLAFNSWAIPPAPFYVFIKNNSTIITERLLDVV